eukprot:6084945-Amphidinium_carterae.1
MGLKLSRKAIMHCDVKEPNWMLRTNNLARPEVSALHSLKGCREADMFKLCWFECFALSRFNSSANEHSIGLASYSHETARLFACAASCKSVIQRNLPDKSACGEQRTALEGGVVMFAGAAKIYTPNSVSGGAFFRAPLLCAGRAH